MRPLTRRRLLWLGIGALAFGLSQTDSPPIGHLDAKVAQALLQRSWSKPLLADAENCPGRDPHKLCPVARLSIPAQHTARVVLKQTGDRIPAGGWGHLAGTPLPGAPGNTVFWSYAPEDGAMLQQLRPGDTLVIELPDATQFAYRVTDAQTRDRRALRIEFETRGAALTLISRAGASDARVVVTATPLPRPRMAFAPWRSPAARLADRTPFA